MTVDGIWDTGASGSCISQRVVDTLKPTRLGYRTVLTPAGSSERGVYLLDLILPNNIRVKDVAVFDSEIGDQGIDVLIGMDIISMGDFAVSNSGGKLVFTFRTPSIKTTNYVAEVNKENIWAKAQVNRGNRKKKY